MPESILHISYVERMVAYTQSIPSTFAASMMQADLSSYEQRTPKIINGYYPDLFYYDREVIVIGEAKTCADVLNEHTINQLDSYIEEVRSYSCQKHIVLCSCTLAFKQLKNLIIRKKQKEQLDDIKFHILDNHLLSVIL